ncbi:MAG: N-methyl-L-tryptophan oxidase [Gemmatimonadota bacterium]
MNRSSCDVLVAGLGGMGSQIVLELARRGLRVVGLDRFRPPHGSGSSHGHSRIIRQAYFEHPLYVPLVMRSYQKWRALETLSGVPLMTRTGGLMLGPEDSTLVRGARQSAELHGLPFDVLDSAAIRWRFPAFRPGPDTVGLFEPEAGVLDPERAISLALELATRAGADLRFDQPLLEWNATASGVTIRTSAGELDADRLVLAAGPWMPGLLGPDWPLETERQVMFWFDPLSDPKQFARGALPIWIWEWQPGHQMYGFPDLGDGIKVARHHDGIRGPLDSLSPDVSPDEVGQLRQWLAEHLPGANGRLRESSVCRYTDAPDDHFVVGPHPIQPGVTIVSPCSGHGFKFAPVIGEIVADLVEGRQSGFDISPFSPARFRLA